MWIHRLQRMGTSAVVTIPRDVLRLWDKDHVRFVEVVLRGSELVITPLPMQALVNRSASEEEQL